MNLFNVKLRRITTNTILSLHIYAKHHLDAYRFARNEMTDKHNWVTQSYTVCDVPDAPFNFDYKGAMVWMYYDWNTDDRQYEVLYPGESKTVILDIPSYSSVFDVKNFLQETLV